MDESAMPAAVGLLGGGVIGGGWAARFLLNGSDVRLYDPDPEAPRKVDEVVGNARRALRRLVLAPLPVEGSLTYVATPEEAVDGVDFVQESAPEQVELKRRLLAAASRAAGPDVVFGSSTSGLLPTQLATDMSGPHRFCVGHPFNPVYLLPLVEVVGGEATATATIEHAAAVYRSVGMQPLHVRNEIDGFVADRLLEALWREALWLVHDGVATVSEIDDAIRYGAGLRWSFMGTFLTYRIAGGEAGMRHFMSQFGPALKWPWSKLVDVPELTDDLLDRLVAQSDAQAAGRSLRELEQVRDDCLVAVLQGLRSQSFGAGTVLDAYERGLVGRARAQAPGAADLTAPLVLHHAIVPPEWTDYNGHLHESRYLQVLGDASDALFRFVGVDADYLAAGRSFYTVETHLCFLREVLAGERLEVAIQVLGADQKRIHAFLELRRDDGEVVATAEHLYLHVDTRAGRASPAEPAVAARVEELRAAHAALPTPPRAGRRIGLTER